jgi:hypothetical protein
MNRPNPVFVGGVDRSGKTLLRIALGAHPSLAMVRGLELWTGFYGRFGDLRRAENATRIIAALLANRRLADSPDVERRLEGHRYGTTYEALFAEIGTLAAEHAGKPRWGQQEALIERHADEVFRMFPAANVIQMLRDPRARYAAMAVSSAAPRGGVGSAVASWLESSALAKRNTQRWPRQYRILRLENLVAQPESVLRDLCGFLGEPYDDRMLQALSGRSQGANGGLFGSGGDRLSASLSPRDVAFIEAHAAGPMRDNGYELSAVHLKGVSALRYLAIDSPRNLASMLAWRLKAWQASRGVT